MTFEFCPDHWKKNRRKKKCMIGNEVFDSVRTAAKRFGLGSSCMGKKIKQSKGDPWECLKLVTTGVNHGKEAN